ncbi:MAG: YjbQ family protein [[Clostridium] scindens]
MEVLKIQSDQHGVLDLTSMVKDIVEKSSVSEGLCCVFVPHTTAGLVIYSGIDPKGLLDLNDTR